MLRPNSDDDREALLAPQSVTTPPTIDDAPVQEPAAPPTDAAPQPAAPEPLPVLPFTLDELFNDPRASKEACRLNDDLEKSLAANDALRNSERRARIDATDAKQKLQQYVRALREGALELNAAGVRTTIDHLVNQPAELPSLVRRLAKVVREIGPDRDALRVEIRRLNGEILDHPEELAAKDEVIKQLRADFDAGKQREKALERTAEQMQVARDSAERQLKQQQSFALEAARANDELRDKVEKLEATVAKLTAHPKPATLHSSAKTEAKAS